MQTRFTGLSGLIATAALLLAACGGDDPLGECPPGSQNTQSIGASVLYITCVGCHSVNLTGADRQGAPVGKDYDNLELVTPQAEEIWEIVQTGTMPPPAPGYPGLNDEQIEAVRIYLACNAR